MLLGHGSGGKLSAELMRDVFLPALENPILEKLDDQAIVEVKGMRLAFTTDSFVVKPLIFRGGDIGSLAVHGTVNDLAMGGAMPLFLSAAFIIEEGLPIETLRRVVESMARAAREAGVPVVTGDTKVVEKGKGDGLFINTSGVGLVREGLQLSANQARPGDRILLSGSVGDHGIAIMAEREGLEFATLARKRQRGAAHAGGRDAGSQHRHPLLARSHARRPVQHAERNRRRVRGGHAARRRAHPDSRGSARRLRDAGPRSALCRQRRQAGGHRGSRARPMPYWRRCASIRSGAARSSSAR